MTGKGGTAMAVMDEFREEREALKNGTLKQKLSYFVYYYKWHVIVTVLSVILVVSLIVQMVTRKDTAFYVCMLNTSPQNAEQYTADFAEFAEIDLNTYNVIFDTSMSISQGEILDQDTVASTEKLMVYIAASELDVMVTDEASIQEYANAEYFFDLREFLTPEQVEQCEPYFYYVDWKVVEEWRAAIDNFDQSYVPSYPDPRKPEEMEQPVPVGIYLDKSEALKRSFYFLSDDVVLTVFRSTTKPETALKFVDFLMKEGN